MFHTCAFKWSVIRKKNSHFKNHQGGHQTTFFQCGCFFCNIKLKSNQWSHIFSAIPGRAPHLMGLPCSAYIVCERQHKRPTFFKGPKKEKNFSVTLSTWPEQLTRILTWCAMEHKGFFTVFTMPPHSLIFHKAVLRGKQIQVLTLP